MLSKFDNMLCQEQSAEREVERDELQQNVEQLEKLKRDSESWRGREQRLQREVGRLGELET